MMHKLIANSTERTDSNRLQPDLNDKRITKFAPKSVDSNQLQSKTPSEHAARLLMWLQTENGRTATISAAELKAIHVEMCAELNWEVISWIRVGRQLRKLIGTRKQYVSVRSRRICVYCIPPEIISDADRSEITTHNR